MNEAAETRIDNLREAHAWVGAAQKRIEQLEKKLAEMTRRRDTWKAKAEGYDAVRLALREKVGSPWPPHMSRIIWAGIAADEKKRADDAEANLSELTGILEGWGDQMRLDAELMQHTKAKLAEVEATLQSERGAAWEVADSAWKRRAEAAEAAIPRAYQMGLDAAALGLIARDKEVYGGLYEWEARQMGNYIRAIQPPADLVERVKGGE